MKNLEQTIERLIDRQSGACIGSIDYCVLRFTALKGRFYKDFSSEEFTIR